MKHGRARFISENKICLACPPNKNLEDIEMTEYTFDRESAEAVGAVDAVGAIEQAEGAEEFEAVEDTASEAAEPAAGFEEEFSAHTEQPEAGNKSDGQLTPLRILESIEIMSNYELAFAESVMDKVLSVHSDGPGDSAPYAKAQALERIAAGYEETARQRLALLREMYQDIKNK